MLGRGCAYHIAHVKVKGQFTGVNSLFPPRGISGWNDCHQTWHQPPLAAEPSHPQALRFLLLMRFLFCFVLFLFLVHTPTSDMLRQYPLSQDLIVSTLYPSRCLTNAARNEHSQHSRSPDNTGRGALRPLS